MSNSTRGNLTLGSFTRGYQTLGNQAAKAGGAPSSLLYLNMWSYILSIDVYYVKIEFTVIFRKMKHAMISRFFW